jgi:hypothetical protein
MTQEIVTEGGLRLEPAFGFTALLKPPLQLGSGPYGQRAFFEVTGGEVSGERLSGRVLGGGGDWPLIGADGYARLDVRAQIETADGATIYVSYPGILEFNEKVQTALGSGQGTDWGDQYFRTAPRLETGDERYAWVNQSMFLAEGRVIPGPGVAYQVYRVG